MTALAKKVFELFGKPELAAQLPAATVRPISKSRSFHVDDKEGAPSPASTVAASPSRKREILPHPYINARGALIIPFESDVRFHWWAGGQSIQKTLLELGAPPDVLARYVDSDSSLRVRQ